MQIDKNFLDRLMRVRDEKGSFYEYAYDAIGNMIQRGITSYTWTQGRDCPC